MFDDDYDDDVYMLTHVVFSFGFEPPPEEGILQLKFVGEM